MRRTVMTKTGETDDRYTVTATLRNAVRSPCRSDGAYVIYGDVYGDIRGWFMDGQEIRTSIVVHEEGDLVRTLNSLYRIEGEIT